ncbi:MAG TPA: hypothetical protein ENF25_02765 [Thermoprotei archaeon]|nr:hypothetical protein [Thermoprotei archaeon]
MENFEKILSSFKRYYLLVTDGCPHCEVKKRELADLISMGIVKVVKPTDPIGQKIIKELGVRHVPFLAQEEGGKLAPAENPKAEVEVGCDFLEALDIDEAYFVVGVERPKDLPSDAVVIELAKGECTETLKKMGINGEGVWLKKRGRVKRIK